MVLESKLTFDYQFRLIKDLTTRLYIQLSRKTKINNHKAFIGSHFGNKLYVNLGIVKFCQKLEPVQYNVSISHYTYYTLNFVA